MSVNSRSATALRSVIKYGNSDDFAPPVIISKGASFQDMVALKGKPDIGDRINKQVIRQLVVRNAPLALASAGRFCRSSVPSCPFLDR